MKAISLVTLAALGMVVSFTVQADPIASRDQLNALLGASAENESFSELGSSSPRVSTINSSNGLSATDLSFVSAASSFQTDSPGYYGALSNEILTNSGLLTMDFLGSTNAFGVDVRDFAGYSMTATITVYGTDDSTVLETLSPYAISNSGATSFIGYQNAAGIGAVSFTSVGGNRWSPLVSNVTYGAVAVPEPATLALLGMGIAGLLGLKELRHRKAC